MSCDYYTLEDYDSIHFSDGDDSICCLCTVMADTRLDSELVRALTYLGAAVVLMQHDQLEHGFLPACLPQQMRDDIDFFFKDYEK